MKHFLLRQVHEVELYVQAESEEEALATWGETIRVILEGKDGVMIGPGTKGYEDFFASRVGQTEIQEINEYGYPI